HVLSYIFTWIESAFEVGGGPCNVRVVVLIALAACWSSAPLLAQEEKASATNCATVGVRIEIERIVVHKNYKPNTGEKDIALIKLEGASRAETTTERRADHEFRSAAMNLSIQTL